MGLSLIAAALLACAMQVSPVTLNAIIQVESRDQPLAIHVNGRDDRPVAGSMEDAVRLVEGLIRRGESVDIGYMQVNSKNLPALGLSVRQVLEPCTNIKAGASILMGYYAQAVKIYGPGQRALQAALSAYNTGSLSAGFRNGYVSRYYGHAHVPTVTVSMPSAPRPALRIPAALARYSASTEVYSRIALNVPVD